MSQTYKTHTAASHAATQRSKNAVATAADDKRKKFIKAIRAKKNQLGMDDATYYAMMFACTGKTSSTVCTVTELGNLCQRLTESGAVNPKAPVRVPRRTSIAADRQALFSKVNALLGELVKVTDITDTVKYVNAICARNGWCTAVDFADAHILHKLVGALSRTLSCKTKSANVSASKG